MLSCRNIIDDELCKYFNKPIKELYGYGYSRGLFGNSDVIVKLWKKEFYANF